MNIELNKPNRPILIDALLWTEKRFIPTTCSKEKAERWESRYLVLLGYLEFSSLTAGNISEKTKLYDRRLISRTLQELEKNGRVKRFRYNGPFEITHSGLAYLKKLNNANNHH